MYIRFIIEFKSEQIYSLRVDETNIAALSTTITLLPELPNFLR